MAEPGEWDESLPVVFARDMDDARMRRSATTVTVTQSPLGERLPDQMDSDIPGEKTEGQDQAMSMSDTAISSHEEKPVSALAHHENSKPMTEAAEESESPLQFVASPLRHQSRMLLPPEASPSSRTRSRKGPLQPPLESPKRRRSSTTQRSPVKRADFSLAGSPGNQGTSPDASSHPITTIARPLLHQHSSHRALPVSIKREQSQSPVVTRSHCAYHKVRISHGDDAFTFLAPQCTLSDRGLLDELDAEDLGPADPTEPTVQLEDQFPSVANDALVAKARRLVGPELVEEGIALVSMEEESNEPGGTPGREPTSAVKARLSLASGSVLSTPPPRSRKRQQQDAHQAASAPSGEEQTSPLKSPVLDSPASATRKRKLHLASDSTDAEKADGQQEGNPTKKSRWWFW